MFTLPTFKEELRKTNFVVENRFVFKKLCCSWTAAGLFRSRFKCLTKGQANYVNFEKDDISEDFDADRT